MVMAEPFMVMDDHSIEKNKDTMKHVVLPTG